MAALYGWQLWSLDISTAFLQGWTFEEMNEAGFKRQPVAFRPPEGFWDVMKELAPGTFAKVTGDLLEWCSQLLKAAYGLKMRLCCGT